MTTHTKVWMAGVLFLAVAGTIIPGVAQAQSYMGAYRVLLIVVDFKDEPGTLDAEDFQNNWVEPLEKYFDHMSSSQLNLRCTLVDHVIHLDERKYYHHCTLGADCVNEWTGADNPIQQAVDDGSIDATADGLAPHGGSPDEVFDGILLLTAPEVVYQYPGWSTSGQHPTADISSRTYAIGFAITSFAGTLNYGVAAHELGHMISGMYTHPAGYISAYELMDSCYPCALGIFTRVDRSALTGDFLEWFSGWLPSSRFVTYAPLTGGGTEVLSPVEWRPEETVAPQGMQVMTNGGYSYICECRRFIPPDDIIPERPNTREGILILKSTPGADPEQELMLAPGFDPLDRWESSFITGQTFTDPSQDLAISVGPNADLGCTVTVTYGPNANTAIPDVALLPWLTPPMDTYETVDIWVDSPANGFERDNPGDPNRLRYGRRGDPETTVIGNGDDPCANEENLVYARIRNLGSAVANNVVVHFEVTEPLGVGIRDDTGWTRFATVSKNDFPALAGIAPGTYTDVFTTWIPKVDFPPGEERIPFHSCLRIVVDTVSGELVTANQDGNREQENIGWFEMITEPEYLEFEPIHEKIFLANEYEIAREFFLSVTSDLPKGWTLDIGSGEASYLLQPNEVLDIPVRLTAPPKTNIGGTHLVDIRAYVKTSSYRPDGVKQYDSREVAGVLIAAQTVVRTRCTISAVYTQSPRRIIHVTGKLDPPITEGNVCIRYQTPNGYTILRTVAVKNGEFGYELGIESLGVYKMRGLYAGSMTQSSTLSEEVSVTASDSPHPADPDLNFRISMSEAIAYLAGWQTGSNLMSMAIRAAYLWQNGEAYIYTSEGEPPLCWILAPQQ